MVYGLMIRVQSRQDGVDFSLLSMVKAKLFLDLAIEDYNALLQSVIDRAIDDVERFTGLAIGPQVRKISYSVLTETVPLPYGPYLETVSVFSGGIIDEDGRLTANWPAGDSVVVKCGYDADTIPKGLLDAVAQAAAEYSGMNPSIKAGSWQPTARRFRTFTWAS